jgi:hypothetical protein
MIDRHEMINNILEEKKLRSFIRKDLKRFLRNKKTLAIEKVHEEARLREVIRHLIREAATTDVPDAQPHENTGINVLEELLKNIIPIVEDGYKALTSASEQRSSFRAHILNGVENALKPVEVVASIGDKGEESSPEETELEEQDIKINVEDEDADKFIPVRDVDTPEEEPEEDAFTIAGEDLTGRNFASITFNKIEKQVLDAYESLANDEDRTLFYDYLLTNLKLYFDKFEDELQANVDEPPSPDYSEPAAEADPMAPDAAADGETDLF